jgi:hypothetical protein
MGDMYSRLTGRRARLLVQAATMVAVLAAVALAWVEEPLARAAAAVLLGGVATAGVKLGLVGLQRLAAVPVSTPQVDLSATQRDIAEVRARVVDTIGAVDRLSADIEPLGERVDHQAMLAARTEPAIAEFATLRHEVLYLREAIERLRADLDSEVSSPDQR